ncbi:hypothetical protein D9757_000553 [Collybiopsis confluens]|uniref:SEC7 domain-containing protein n=1 Tax=Collybiopsis confluens TaxID=2823264 RepID=A0A8H5I1M8_9AGAR|nr:hypothetical protein D9757_000553 [Collybiopsis confluens]
MILKEGVDINSLGVLDSPTPPAPLPKSPKYRTPPSSKFQPSTPTIVPPTPSPVPGPSSAKIPRPSSDFSDDEDNTNTHNVNRRSLYRGTGISSSPDLATLLRKAKEKGGAISSGHFQRERRRDSPPPPPLPQFPSTPQASPMPPGKRPGDSDWVLPSPNFTTGSPGKPLKSSVRSKASTFLGKMLGQNTVRERSKTDAAYASTSRSSSTALHDAFVPPVPPLPIGRPTPTGSPIADVFSSSLPSIPPLRTSSTSKPLPPIVGAPSDNEDDQSIVIVDRITPSENATVKGKRRSLSISGTDLGRIAASGSGSSPPRTPPRFPLRSRAVEKDEARGVNPVGSGRPEDTTLNGILNDFKGELSQLDPITTSNLDLRDPSTPARRARSNTDGPVLFREGGGAEAQSRRASSVISAPVLTLQPPFRTYDEEANSDRLSPLSSATSARRVSTMISSLEPSPGSPIRPSSASSGASRMTRQNLTPLRSRSGPVDSSSTYGNLPSPNSSSARGLRVIHRSTASSSEPSLIPTVVAADGTRILSQQDLTVNDLVLVRHASSGTVPGKRSSTISGTGSSTVEDGGDLDARGHELASRCWIEDEEFLGREKIAEWLGGNGLINKVALQYYISNFDFSNLRLDMAFRRLCAKLYLKAETQQVDRILEEFSKRYWECNPNTLYGSSSTSPPPCSSSIQFFDRSSSVDLVHAVSYSLLLLNTDLHVAELTSRMSRSQFVRNTLAAIQMQLQPSSSSTSPDASTLDIGEDSTSLRSFPAAGNNSQEPHGTESIGRSKRSDSITSWNSISRDTILSSPALSLATTQATTPVMENDSMQNVGDLKSSTSSTPSSSNVIYGRAWETNMENLLKEMYNAIKNQQILQPLTSSRLSTSSLSPGGPMLRNRSLRSQPDRLMTLKRGSIRGIQSIMGSGGTSPYSSNSSIDGRVSPSPSYATSTHEAMQASSSSFLSPTLGFASNLSHTIIRETQEDDDRSDHSVNSSGTSISITDEELALLGPPWAKEGMLCRKQYWDAANKRAKDKAWMDVFVVIQKAELNMFTFGENGAGGSGVFGGGNWLPNANRVGVVQLAHSLAHALPPPGYNRQRPHCMVLTLANGGVYFFQAGTEELVNEWVSTCNYWAARTSKEPLAGGVSNMEYGWNRVTEPVHGRSQSDSESVRESDATSIRSGKSARSRFNWREGAATVRSGTSPWNERIFINDWKPPMPPTVSSVHDEESQLDALKKHVRSLKRDLQRHNELREPMSTLYQPRTSNAIKAMSNWEKRSQYLLTEIVKNEERKASLYILGNELDCVLIKCVTTALEQALNGTSPTEILYKNSEATIQEDEEPLTPGPGKNSHMRESADAGDDIDA